MATFAELQERVGRLIIDLPSFVTDEVPKYINLALRQIQTRHNFAIMEALSSVYVTTEATRTLATLPTNFKAYRDLPYVIEAEGGVRELLNPTNRNALIRDLGDTSGGETDLDVVSGAPKALLFSEPADEAGTRNIEVWPLPDGLSTYGDTSPGEYRIRLPYWKWLTALSADSDSNWFTADILGEEYIVRQAVANGFFADWDEERGALWTQRATEPANQLILEDKQRKLAAVTHLVPHHDAGGSRLRYMNSNFGRRGL